MISQLPRAGRTDDEACCHANMSKAKHRVEAMLQMTEKLTKRHTAEMDALCTENDELKVKQETLTRENETLRAENARLNTALQPANLELTAAVQRTAQRQAMNAEHNQRLQVLERSMEQLLQMAGNKHSA